MQPGDRVRNGAQGPLFNVLGTVVKPLATHRGGPERVWIRWDGNVLSNGYPLRHTVLEQSVIVEKGPRS